MPRGLPPTGETSRSFHGHWVSPVSCFDSSQRLRENRTVNSFPGWPKTDHSREVIEAAYARSDPFENRHF